MSVTEIDTDPFQELLFQTYGIDTPPKQDGIRPIPPKLTEISSLSLLKRSLVQLREKSKIFETPGPKFSQGRIGGINGINTAFTEAENYAHRLSHYAQNFSVEWVYNCSHSALVDLCETFLLNYRSISSPASLLKSRWSEFHETFKEHPQAKYLQLCHSQGAIHVRNALYSSPQEIKDRIIVLAIAPAAIIPSALCFKAYNYASKWDLIRYGEIVYDAFLLPQKVKGDYAALKELILLEPPPGADLLDHSFNSPTFEKIIAGHIHQFLEEYGGTG